MKKLLFLIPLVACLAAVYPVYYVQPAGHDFVVGSHSYNTATLQGATSTNIDGYLFNTADTTMTRWAFPASIMQGTQCVVTVYQFCDTTNLIDYNMTLAFFTTNGPNYVTNTRIFDSTALFQGTLSRTNVYAATITNVIPTGLLSTNVNYGTVSFQHRVTGLVSKVWLLGGRIYFRNGTNWNN